jgi:hypothetical protein
VDHPVEGAAREGPLDRGAVLQGGPDEPEARPAGEPGQPGLFEGDVVVGVQVVQADDLVAGGDEARSMMTRRPT